MLECFINTSLGVGENGTIGFGQGSPHQPPSDDREVKWAPRNHGGEPESTNLIRSRRCRSLKRFLNESRYFNRVLILSSLAGVPLQGVLSSTFLYRCLNGWNDTISHGFLLPVK